MRTNTFVVLSVLISIIMFIGGITTMNVILRMGGL